MCVVSPHNTEIFSYQSGGEARLGVKMMVLGSGWSPPIPLQAGELSGAPSSDSSSTSEKVVKQLTSGGYTGNRMIIWAEVPEVNTLVPVAAYLDHAGERNYTARFSCEKFAQFLCWCSRCICIMDVRQPLL